MLNFDVISAGHDTISDAGYHVQAQIQSPIVTNKNNKNVGPFENMSFSMKPFEDFNKKNKTNFLPRANNSMEHKDPESIN